MATQKPDIKKASGLARKQKRRMTIKLKDRTWDAAENLETERNVKLMKNPIFFLPFIFLKCESRRIHAQ
jgi:hypothetical protein